MSGNDLRGNTTGAFKAITGAGNPAPSPTPSLSPFPSPFATTFPDFVQGNLVAGYSSPYAIATGTTIIISGNSGSSLTPSASASPCTVQDWQFNGTLIGCMDVNGALTLSGNLASSNVAPSGHYNTQSTNGGAARRASLVAGAYTWTFATAYASTPVCFGMEEANVRQLAITAISSTSVTFTSSLTVGNTDMVDLFCVGNPN